MMLYYDKKQHSTYMVLSSVLCTMYVQFYAFLMISETDFLLLSYMELN